MSRNFLLDMVGVLVVTIIAGLVVEYAKNNVQSIRRTVQ